MAIEFPALALDAGEEGAHHLDAEIFAPSVVRERDLLWATNGPRAAVPPTPVP